MDVKTSQLQITASKINIAALLASQDESSFSPAPKEIYDVIINNTSTEDILIQSVSTVSEPSHDLGITLTPGQSISLDRFTTRFVYLSAPNYVTPPAPFIEILFKIV